MKKQTYNVYLDSAEVRDLKTWLKPQGVSFSGYLSVVIHDTLSAVSSVIDNNKTPVLTAAGLLQVAQQMAKEMAKDAKKKRK